MDGHKLRIFDVSNPAQPQHVQDCAVGSFNSHALIEGDWLWGWGFNSPQCFSITNELNPVRAEINNAFVGGSAHAYFQTADGRLVPWTERGNLKPAEPLDAETIVIYDKYAFVGGRGGRVFDLSNPAQPRQVAALRVSGKMVLGDGRLYTPSSVMDITHPDAPRTIGSRQGHVPMVAYGNSIYSTRGMALVSFDVSNPASPIEIQSFPLDYKPEALYCKGDLLFASTGWDGRLCVYRILPDGSLKRSVLRWDTRDWVRRRST